MILLLTMDAPQALNASVGGLCPFGDAQLNPFTLIEGIQGTKDNQDGEGESLRISGALFKGSAVDQD